MVGKHPKGSHNPSQKSLQRWDNEGGAPKGGRPERPQVAAKKAKPMVVVMPTGHTTQMGGGRGAGTGAAIGGLVGAGGGTLYGLNENKKHDQTYRDAYASCMRGRGYTG